MKRVYNLHYKENLDNGMDEIIKIKLEEVGECPHCHIATSPTFIDGYYISSMENDINPTAYIIFYCPSCHALYIAVYYIPDGFLYHGDFLATDMDAFLIAVYPNSPKKVEFSGNINKLSPMFVSTYKQALYAESDQNTAGLSGLGYCKALEFLIKDYLITLKNQDRDTIIQLELGKCVDKLSDDLQSIARASVWLGNDETHYFKKNENYSIQDLKEFINCLVADIEMEYVRIKANKLTKSKK